MTTKQTPMDEKLKLELDIIIFTLVINLGFFKITEVQSFVSLLGTMFKNDSHTLGVAVFIGAIVIAYFAYVICVGVGLYNAFRRKDTSNAIVFALVSFFTLYILITYRTVSTYEFPVAQVPSRVSQTLIQSNATSPAQH